MNETLLNKFSGFDVIIAVILLASFFIGKNRGFVVELFSWLAWVIAYFVAKTYGMQIATALPLSAMPEAVQFLAGFVIAFALSLLLTGLFASWLKSFVNDAGGGLADQLLGGLFGILRGVVIIFLITVLIFTLAWEESTWWKKSFFAPYLHQTFDTYKKIVPDNWPKGQIPYIHELEKLRHPNLNQPKS